MMPLEAKQSSNERTENNNFVNTQTANVLRQRRIDQKQQKNQTNNRRSNSFHYLSPTIITRLNPI